MLGKHLLLKEENVSSVPRTLRHVMLLCNHRAGEMETDGFLELRSSQSS